MTQTDPYLNDLLVKERHKRFAQETETRRRRDLASGGSGDGLPHRGQALLGRTRHLVGTALIGVGTRLQGVRRPELPDLPVPEAPTRATPSLP